MKTRARSNRFTPREGDPDLQRITKLAKYLEDRPVTMLMLIVVMGILFRVSILYPSWANGLPSGYDTYIHAASAYFIAEGGLAAAPTSPIYPPIFLILLAFVYRITGIQPIYLVYPIGIAFDVLAIPLMYYITRKISGNNGTMAVFAAFLTSINPITVSLLVLGLVPFLLAMLGFLLIICIIVSDMYRSTLGVLLMGLLGAFIAFTHTLVFAFLVFFGTLVLIYELVLKREKRYSDSIVISLAIAISWAALYYVPLIGYIYFGTLTGVEYLIYSVYNAFILPVLCLPALFIFRARRRKKYLPAGYRHLNILKLWYLSAPLMCVIFIWQTSVSTRMYELIAYPTIVVLGMIFVKNYWMAKKIRKQRHVAAKAATILIVSMVLSYTTAVLDFNDSFKATPPRLELINWIDTYTPQNATFCTEEEYFPTQLGWYVMGLTGRMAYLSYQAFSGPFEVGTDIARQIKLAHNITSLTVATPDWLSAVRELRVTFVVLLAGVSHPNYALISDQTVFTNSAYVVYNVTNYAFP